MGKTQDLLDRELRGEFPQQKTEKWYLERKKLLTASDVSTILECNIYISAYELLLKKISYVEQETNDAMKWGNLFEPIAVLIYEQKINERCFPIGLVKHKKYEWLGASPDGLLLSGKLLEIKCPVKRLIYNTVPYYYWIQTQIQMEVCDIDECDYFECKFTQYAKQEPDSSSYINNGEVIYYKLLEWNLQTIKRDKKWFSSIVQKLQIFYENMIYYRNIKDGIKHFKIDTSKNLKRKYINSVKDGSIYTKWDNWVSATRIYNYMIDDPIIDWLEIIHKSNISNHGACDTFQQCIMKNGLKFEQNIINIIKSKFKKSEFITIASYEEAKSYDKYLKTVSCIKKKTPIIYQGVLHDYKHKLFGMPDLIVRCDYINKIFNDQVVKNPSKNHYRIIDIKFIKLNLCSNGKYLRNTGKTNAYKGQLYIYNKILSTIQNYEPCKTYIIGKSWTFTKCSIQFNGHSFDRPAHINYKNNDKFIRGKTSHAIKWIRELKTNSNNMVVYSRHELKPNMCNNDQKWYTIKKEIANNHNDITLLWHCGIKHRQIAESKGITNWKKYKGLTSEMLGVYGDKISSTLQIIIDMNQDIEQTEIITPKYIKNNLFNWKTNKSLEFFIDFETINDTICEENAFNGSFIFMIGVGAVICNTWVYKTFMANTLTKDGELTMLCEFHKYIEHYDSEKSLWHWGNAEKYLYTSAINRNPEVLEKHNLLVNWCDMLKIFHEEPIVSRGMLNFSLKSVVSSFYKNGFIDITYSNNNILNGLDAMVIAYNIYTKKCDIHKSKEMCQIIQYNEVDVKALYYIISYLRKKHI